MEEFNLNLLNLLGVLSAAWVGAALSRKLGYPAILGELIIGIILGPGLLGWLEFTETIKVLSEVGIILLMVYIGIEIDFRDLKKASWPGLLASIGGFLVPFILGYLSIIWFGGSPISGLFVGMAVGVTSLATKSRILVDLKLLNTRIAYVLMAGALISDTLALLIFAGIVSFIDPGSFDMIGLVVVAGKAVAFFTITILIGLFILPRLGAFFSKFKYQNSTLYFTVLLIIAFGYAELAELAGMHSILGAFMAGLFIKKNLFPKSISKEVNKAFYDVSIGFMAPIFFVSAGFFVSLSVFQTDLTMLLTVILLAIIGKIFGTALFYLPSGYGWREGITVGTGMNGRGAVEIIIAGIGLEMGIIDQNIFSILVFMAIFTTMTVPFLLKWTSEWLKRRGELVTVGERKGFLILGVNPVSLLMAEHLKEKTDVVMIDSNQEAVNHALEKGIKCKHGNSLKEDVMSDAGAGTMQTFLGMTGNTEINILTAQFARESFQIPNSHVVVSKNQAGAGMDILNMLGATSLFASGIDAELWVSKDSGKQLIEDHEVIHKRIETRAWVKKKKENADEKALPLLIEDTMGAKRPFHFGDIIEAGEKVITIRFTYVLD
jgi:Kef-type K+ transport system membrane component KefB